MNPDLTFSDLMIIERALALLTQDVEDMAERDDRPPTSDELIEIDQINSLLVKIHKNLD